MTLSVKPIQPSAWKAGLIGVGQTDFVTKLLRKLSSWAFTSSNPWPAVRVHSETPVTSPLLCVTYNSSLRAREIRGSHWNQRCDHWYDDTRGSFLFFLYLVVLSCSWFWKEDFVRDSLDIISFGEGPQWLIACPGLWKHMLNQKGLVLEALPSIILFFSLKE